MSDAALTAASTGGAGRIRTRDTRVKSPLRPDAATCRNVREGHLTCGFVYSVQPIVWRRFAVFRGTAAGQRRDDWATKQ